MFDTQPDKKKEAPRPSKESEEISRWITEMIHESVVMTGLGAAHYFNLLYRKPVITGLLSAGFYFGLKYSIGEAHHMMLLHELDPETFDLEAIQWMTQFPVSTHFWTIFTLLTLFILVVLGCQLRFLRTKYRKLFQHAGVITSDKNAPVLLKKIKLGPGRTKLIFDSKGIGISNFESKIDNLEAEFDQDIEKIEHGKSKGQIVITLTKRKLEDLILFEEMLRENRLPESSFFIGDSTEGVLTQKISELPHLLVAATTGAGKSVFCKQLLAGLLESSPHLQMYLIDLKGGLEMVDFASAPNVKVIKKMSDAVTILKKIRSEMEARFSYLEEQGKKTIDPKRDKKDRIVLLIDEASVLYMTRKKNDPNYALALEARQITDGIAKLSRAAAIHLILATQKVSKETIDTAIQENISARMSFKMNTISNSLIVLGNKAAFELPDTKGRGIWCFGNRQITVQAFFINEAQIREICEKLKEEFDSGQRSFLSPMLGSEDVTRKSKKSLTALVEASSQSNEKA